MELKKQKFPIWQSRLSRSYTKTSVTVCAQGGRRLHGHMRVVEHATVELLGQWCSGRSNATPRWDAVSVVDVANPATVDALLEHTPHLVGPRDLGQGYWAATATGGGEIWCIARQKFHAVTSSVSWSIVLLGSEEVSCYGTTRRQEVLTEQDVTVISAINFYTRLNEHQFGSSKYQHGDRDHDRFWESGPSTQETLGWYLHLPANRYFPYWKLLYLSFIFKTAVA